MHPKRYKIDDKTSALSSLIKEKHKHLYLTQPDLAQNAGVGLRFIREMEQGKTTLRMDKVNQVLQLFGAELGAVPINRKQWFPHKFQYLKHTSS